ncbi:hypothetical protein [uncultured Vagococcus sp.]|uniref:hypothetical protein n=1 Tax=uncultured Vagococcus sp. TaxID=189676 RepID=UPI0028D37B2E|nr:hypothetical protein [uncultured Vagococcus sp.]
MNFKKRLVTEEELKEFAKVPLVDPVSQKLSQPKNVTIAENEGVYLVSLSNQHISFSYEMPRYFVLDYKGLLIFFFVIDHTELSDEVTKSIFAKGIKMPKKLIRETLEIRKLIIKALFVYYGDYKINQIILDEVAEISYYLRMEEGKLRFT